MASGERGHEPGGVGLPAQRQGRQLQPGRPALGPRGQRRHRRRRRGPRRDTAAPCRSSAAASSGGESQFRGAQLGQLPAAPQPGQGQRRVAAAGQHQVQSRRPVLDQEPERLVHGCGVDQVVVVEHQQRLVRVRLGGQFVDQRGHQSLVRRRRGRPEQRAHPFGEPRPHWSSAATAWRQNRAGSLSPASSDSHATGCRPRRAQSASRTVLPYPAGAQTSISPRARPSSRRSANRGRGTRSGRGLGTCSLVASRTSRSVGLPVGPRNGSAMVPADRRLQRSCVAPEPVITSD